MRPFIIDIAAINIIVLMIIIIIINHHQNHQSCKSCRNLCQILRKGIKFIFFMIRDWERRDIMKCLLTPALIMRQVDSVKGDLASSKLHKVAVKQTRESCLFSWPPGFTVISSIFTAFVPGGATSWPAVKMNNWCKDGFHKLLVFCTVLLRVVGHVSAVLVEPGAARCDNLFHKQQTVLTVLNSVFFQDLS